MLDTSHGLAGPAFALVCLVKLLILLLTRSTPRRPATRTTPRRVVPLRRIASGVLSGACGRGL